MLRVRDNVGLGGMDRVRVRGRIRVFGRVVRVRVSWPLYQGTLMRIHYPIFCYMTPLYL